MFATAFLFVQKNCIFIQIDIAGRNVYVDGEEVEMIYTVEDSKLRAPTVVYGAILKGEEGENLFLFINGLLEPVDATTSVLKNQLIILTIIPYYIYKVRDIFFCVFHQVFK